MMIKTLTKLALLLAAALLPLASTAISKQAGADVQERYRLEAAACLNGRSTQSLQTCLREAEAVRAQALKADLDAPPTMRAMRAGVVISFLPTKARREALHESRFAMATQLPGPSAGY